MSAHVLMNLLNKLGKRDKRRSLSSVLSLIKISFEVRKGAKIRN